MASSYRSVPRCLITSRSDGHADDDRDQSSPMLIRFVMQVSRAETVGEIRDKGILWVSRYALGFIKIRLGRKVFLV